jgi:uncharacterized OB-fold protein
MDYSTSPPLVPGFNPGLSRDFMTRSGDGLALLGQQCRDCGKLLFPKTGVCPSCRSTELGDHAMPRQGILYSWSVVHVAPKPWITPYVIGYVDLPNGVRVFSHIGGDPAALRVDMPVRVHPAELGVDAQGQPRAFFQFSPVQAEVA